MSSDANSSDESFGKLLQQIQQGVEDRDFEDAADAVHDIFALVEAWRDENPSLYFDLTIKAAEFEECGDWGAAESAYNQILSLSDLAPAREYEAHFNLAGLYRLMGRDSDALDHARRATAAARREDLSFLLAMALRGEASCLIRCGQIIDADNVIAEAISIIDDRKIYNQMRASLLTLRAQCAVRNGAIDEAKRDLEEANCLLEPLVGMDDAAGIHNDLSLWWSVVARLRSKCDDRDGSVAAWQKSVYSSKHVASLAHANNVYAKAAVADKLKGLADALLLCERTEDATVAFDEFNLLLHRIGLRTAGAE